ncbi:hypothetical protein HZC07_06190 [Candidatus Micrarchaeota archaeon]|nr:hypothetical protein [Candidatus Micrarchaeota archaeon]
MADIFQAKLRKIGSSIGILIPKDRLTEINANIGEEIDLVVIKHRSKKDVEASFGIASHFTKSFERDKTSREF